MDLHTHLQHRLDKLEAVGAANRFHTRTQQLMGAVGVGGFGVAALTGIPAVMPLAVAGLLIGGSFYAVSTVVEAVKTGAMRPIPTSDVTAEDFFVGLNKEVKESKKAGDTAIVDALLSKPLFNYSYLSVRDKALYTLLHLFGNAIAQVLADTPIDVVDRELEKIITLFIAHYGGYLSGGPYALEGRLNNGHIVQLLTEAPEVRMARVAALPEPTQLTPVVEVEITQPFDITADKEVSIPIPKKSNDAVTVAEPKSVKAGTPRFVVEMTHAVKSSLIVGIPGSGKDLTIAYLLSLIAEKHSGYTLVGIDPKNDAKESGYYRHFRPENLDRFNAALLNPWEIQEILDKRITEVLQMEKVIFFINEFATLAGFCDDRWLRGFNSRLQAIAQMGDSEERYIWIASQTGNLGELKMQPSLRSTLGANMLAIVRPGSDAAINGLTKTDLISNHDDARMRVMMERSVVGRAYYHSRIGQWEPMVELPNLSGYNRDKKVFEPSPDGVPQAQQANVAALERAVAQPAATPQAQPFRIVTDAPPQDDALMAIKSQPDGDHKDALLVAYKWALKRQQQGKPVSKQTFGDRARSERNLSYLKTHSDAVWDDLSVLL